MATVWQRGGSAAAASAAARSAAAQLDHRRRRPRCRVVRQVFAQEGGGSQTAPALEPAPADADDRKLGHPVASQPLGGGGQRPVTVGVAGGGEALLERHPGGGGGLGQ